MAFNLDEYIKKVQTTEDADKLKWEDYANKVKTLNDRNQVLGGAARFADSYAALNPVGMKSNYGGAYPDVKESEVLAQNLLDKTKPKDSTAGMLRLYQAQLRAASGGPKLTKGQEARDVAFAKEMVEYETTGGPEVDSQLDNLTSLTEELKGMKSGGYINAGLGLVKNTDLYKAKQRVAAAVQQTMRPILGAQFTENEGKRIIANAFDAGVDMDENIRRINAIVLKLRIANELKKERMIEFENKGTLSQAKAGYFSDMSAIKNDLLKIIEGKSTGETNSQQNTSIPSVSDIAAERARRKK